MSCRLSTHQIGERTPEQIPEQSRSNSRSNPIKFQIQLELAVGGIFGPGFLEDVGTPGVPRPPELGSSLLIVEKG